MRIRSISIIFLVGLLISGCGTPATTPVTSSTQVMTTGATTSTSAGGQTAGQLASSGQQIFGDRCSGCHGGNGQGVTAPGVIKPAAHLGKYITAQGLFNYIKTNMPANSPGSLSQQDYLAVIAYLLLQNDFVTSNSPLSADNLADIPVSG